MAEKKIDLNRIRDEIANEKKNKYILPSQLGESTGAGVAPRDTFLHGLVTSLTTGKDTASSNLIKVVENATTAKHGGVAVHKINEIAATPQPRKKIDMSPERDEQLFADLEKKRKATLAESIAGFNSKQPITSQSQTVNYNGQQMLTSIPQGTYLPQGGGQINEAVLVESVQQIVNSHLQQNLGPVFEEAIKGTIIEMYAIERIKEVLHENRDLIKDVVVETIKEIQARTKAKKEQS